MTTVPALLIRAALLPITAPAQSGDSSLYVTLDCLGSGRPNAERHAAKTMLPVYQHMVYESRLVSWAFFRVSEKAHANRYPERGF